MSRVRPSPIGDAHAYTRSHEPWSITVGSTPHEKMIGYISGGGMRTFGRTVRQEEIRRRHRRFVWAAVSLLAVWLALLVA